MLARSFLTAKELRITDVQKDALMKTLVVFETGKLSHVSKDLVLHSPDVPRDPSFCGLFNMRSWGADNCARECGTIACIGGTAELLVGEPLFVFITRWSDPRLHDLFYPADLDWEEWYDITPSQAATALRSYLTTGDARWDLAVA